MLKEISETIYWLNWFNKLNQDESERIPEVFSLRPFSLWTKHSSLLSLKNFIYGYENKTGDYQIACNGENCP